MSTRYTIQIHRIDIANELEGNTEVVAIVHWRAYAEKDGVKVKLYGAQTLPPPKGTFVPYDQVDKAKIKQWLLASNAEGLDIDEEGIQTFEQWVKEVLDERLKKKARPKNTHTTFTDGEEEF